MDSGYGSIDLARRSVEMKVKEKSFQLSKKKFFIRYNLF